jgi:hypothetical protein
LAIKNLKFKFGFPFKESGSSSASCGETVEFSTFDEIEHVSICLMVGKNDMD